MINAQTHVDQVIRACCEAKAVRLALKMSKEGVHGRHGVDAGIQVGQQCHAACWKTALGASVQGPVHKVWLSIDGEQEKHKQHCARCDQECVDVFKFFL